MQQKNNTISVVEKVAGKAEEENYCKVHNYTQIMYNYMRIQSYILRADRQLTLC